MPEEAPNAARDLGSLTAKPVLFVANVDEGSEEVPAAVAEHAAAAGRRRGGACPRGSSPSSPSSRTRTRRRCGRSSASASRASQRVVREAFALLELIAFFTAGEAKPAQSWHLRSGLTAWHAAGEIHTRHPEGVRPRRGDRLAGAGRRRRLRRRPRTRHAAPGGPRLRDGRRRRDHGQVHGLERRPGPGTAAAPTRSSRWARRSSRSARRRIPSSRAAARPGREVGGAVGGRATSIGCERRDLA